MSTVWRGLGGLCKSEDQQRAGDGTEAWALTGRDRMGAAVAKALKFEQMLKAHAPKQENTFVWFYIKGISLKENRIQISFSKSYQKINS